MATSGLWSHVSSRVGPITPSRTIGMSSWLDGLEQVNDNRLFMHRQETQKWRSRLCTAIIVVGSSVGLRRVLWSTKQMTTMVQLSLLVRRSSLSLRLLQLISHASCTTIIPLHQVTLLCICLLAFYYVSTLSLFRKKLSHDILEILKV